MSPENLGKKMTCNVMGIKLLTPGLKSIVVLSTTLKFLGHFVEKLPKFHCAVEIAVTVEICKIILTLKIIFNKKTFLKKKNYFQQKVDHPSKYQILQKKSK